MTPRERMIALRDRLRRDGERSTELSVKLMDEAHKCIDRGIESLQDAEALASLIPHLTDSECRKCVEAWGDEEKPS